jgi:hypothetical protein
LKNTYNVEQMSRDHRKKPRRQITTAGMVYGNDGKPIVGCRVRDISDSGVQLALDKDRDLPHKFVLSLSHVGNIRRHCTLVWQFSILVGARFGHSG